MDVIRGDKNGVELRSGVVAGVLSSGSTILEL